MERLFRAKRREEGVTNVPWFPDVDEESPDAGKFEPPVMKENGETSTGRESESNGEKKDKGGLDSEGAAAQAEKLKAKQLRRQQAIATKTDLIDQLLPGHVNPQEIGKRKVITVVGTPAGWQATVEPSEEKSVKSKNHAGKSRKERLNGDFRKWRLSDSESENEVEPGRRNENRVESSDSSESDQLPDRDFRQSGRWDRGPRKDPIKKLQEWKLAFSGEGGATPEEFLEDVSDCKNAHGLTDKEILKALPCILTKGAKRWFRTNRDKLNSWSSFIKAFRNYYIIPLTDDEVMAELQARTQAEGERIGSYLNSFQYIVGHFKKPPSQRRLLELAYKQMLKEYRRQMNTSTIRNFEDLEKHGRRFEKELDLDERWKPPPSREKTRLPESVAPKTKEVVKVAAICESEKQQSSQNNKKKGKNINSTTGSSQGGQAKQSVAESAPKAATGFDQTVLNAVLQLAA